MIKLPGSDEYFLRSESVLGIVRAECREQFKKRNRVPTETEKLGKLKMVLEKSLKLAINLFVQLWNFNNFAPRSCQIFFGHC